MRRTSRGILPPRFAGSTAATSSATLTMRSPSSTPETPVDAAKRRLRGAPGLQAPAKPRRCSPRSGSRRFQRRPAAGTEGGSAPTHILSPGPLRSFGKSIEKQKPSAPGQRSPPAGSTNQMSAGQSSASVGTVGQDLPNIRNRPPITSRTQRLRSPRASSSQARCSRCLRACRSASSPSLALSKFAQPPWSFRQVAFLAASETRWINSGADILLRRAEYHRILARYLARCRRAVRADVTFWSPTAILSNATLTLRFP